MATRKKIENVTAMDRVKLARDPKRPHMMDFVSRICSDFEELHGDRLVNDDRGLICGFATIDDAKGALKVLMIGHHKGATVEENMEANFGMANPDGYRKAMRLAKLAEKFHLPVVTFVDTPGAYPGREAEERGQAEVGLHVLLDRRALVVAEDEALDAADRGEAAHEGAVVVDEPVAVELREVGADARDEVLEVRPLRVARELHAVHCTLSHGEIS